LERVAMGTVTNSKDGKKLSDKVSWIFYVDEDGTISGIEHWNAQDSRKISNEELVKPDPNIGAPYDLEVRIEKRDASNQVTNEASGCIRNNKPVVWGASTPTPSSLSRPQSARPIESEIYRSDGAIVEINVKVMR
jgi:uncharacterized protein YuzE